VDHLGGEPRDLAKSIKSESAVTIVNPSVAAYFQILSSGVDRSKPGTEDVRRAREKLG
jgi:hypothetical protein